jgi:hypothetical protein
MALTDAGAQREFTLTAGLHFHQSARGVTTSKSVVEFDHAVASELVQPLW